ncbi:MAG: Crp/Fnr family transcriptional regulator [Cyanobacteria bacterium P01_F01_bin.42]
MKATVEQLAALALFTELRPADLEALQPHTEIQDYRKGEIVVHEGDQFPAKLHVLFTGELQVQKTAATGKETILRRLGAGDMFAAPALFGNALAPATVSALQDCQVLTVAKSALIAAIQETPEVALRILVVFNQRLQQLHNLVHGLVSERAIVRLARLIQYAAMQHGTQITDQGHKLQVKLPYYQIARSIGITYEECARLMKGLQNVVDYRRGGTIVILDQVGLNAIAEG